MIVLMACAAVIAGWIYSNRYHCQLAREAFERREFEQAQRRLDQRVTLGMGGLEGELLAAQTARRSGNLEEAARRVTRLERRFNGNPAVVLERQLLALQQGDLQEAEKLLDSHGDSSSPDTPWILEAYIVGSLKQLLVAYSHEETYEGSIHAGTLAQTRNAIDKWLELRPNTPDQVSGLVWSYQAHLFAHLLDRANSDINRALQLDPENPQARTILAMHLSQEQPEESARQWQGLHDQFPNDISTSLHLADMRRRLGQLEGAKVLLDDVLAAQPGNVRALVLRGRIALDMEEWTTAEELLRKACREEPDSPEANLALSRCFRATGQVDAAGRLEQKLEKLRAERKRQREAAFSTPLP